MLVVEFLGALFPGPGAQHDAVVDGAPPAAENDLRVGVGVAHVEERPRRVEPRAVQVRQGDGEGLLLCWRQGCDVLDVVEWHFGTGDPIVGCSAIWRLGFGPWGTVPELSLGCVPGRVDVVDVFLNA